MDDASSEIIAVAKAFFDDCPSRNMTMSQHLVSDRRRVGAAGKTL
jgi:hypothetical protein